jgi:folate-binding protein YgfZ
MIAYAFATQYGIIEVRGTDAGDFLQRMSTNDVSSLTVGSATSSVLTTEKGRIVDLVTIVRTSDTSWMLITSPGNDTAVYQWLRKYVIMEDIRFSIQTEHYQTVELWHSDLRKLQATLDSVFKHQNPNSTWMTVYLRLAARIPSGLGLSIAVVPADHYESYTRILQASGIKLLSEQQRTYIRIQNGIGQFPNELNENYTPLDAGLADLIHQTKGCFIGQEVLERLTVQQKARWILCILEFDSAAASDLQTDDRVFSMDNHVGQVTSVASPCPLPEGHAAQQWCALAYLSRHITQDHTLQTHRGNALYLRYTISTTVA